MYERLYGSPLRIAPEEELRAEAEAQQQQYEESGEGERMPDTLWVEGRSGKLEEVEYYYGAPDSGRVVQQGEVLEDEDSLAERLEAMEVEGEEEEGEEWEEGGALADEIRTHPLTFVGRFTTRPTTLQLPKREFVEDRKSVV